ncbi:phosphoprotein [Burg el Arab virus]|nr:phosphoprotein [Burg el Arab virus]UAU42896.1 phosphoprotein [Burg el Arab virus]
MNDHRAKEIEKIYANLKDEPTICGDDCEDTGGMHGLGMSKSLSGNTYIQPLPMGEVHDHREPKESDKSVPWSSDEDSDTDFVDPDRDTGGSSEDEISNREGKGEIEDTPRSSYSLGFQDGMNDAIYKINNLLVRMDIGTLYVEDGQIKIKKSGQEEENSVESSSDTCFGEKHLDTERNVKKPDSISIEMDSDTEDTNVISGEEFLEILDGGLSLELGGRSKFISLDSVCGAKYAENSNKKMTLMEWVVATCP